MTRTPISGNPEETRPSVIGKKLAQQAVLAGLPQVATNPKDGFFLQFTITPRQEHILRLALDGHQNKEIAHRLGILESTIKVYNSKAIRRTGLGIHTKQELSAHYALFLEKRCKSLEWELHSLREAEKTIAGFISSVNKAGESIMTPLRLVREIPPMPGPALQMVQRLNAATTAPVPPEAA